MIENMKFGADYVQKIVFPDIEIPLPGFIIRFSDIALKNVVMPKPEFTFLDYDNSTGQGKIMNMSF